MLCQNCNKKEANVKYTQIIDGEKKEMMLCDECSEKLGINKINFNMPIDFSNFFSNMLSDYEDTEFMPLISQIKQLKCDNCNMTYDEFVNTGKLGCSKCYETFSQKIDPILKRIHGSNRHVGRKISKIQSKSISKTNLIQEESKLTEKEKLEKKLKNAILEERYEEAAQIRDQIKNIKEE